MLQRCAVFIGAAGLVFTVACGQTDVGISTSVKSKLAADDTVSAYQVDVDTREGVVTLSGDVESAAAKAQAVRLARETDGVRDVVDRIRVSETAATGGAYDRGNDFDIGDRAGDAANRAGGVMTDAAITAVVKAKFLADGAVQGLQIDVDTSGGIVTLTGDASSRAAADRAVALARETEGVTRVVDNMRVEVAAGR